MARTALSKSYGARPERGSRTIARPATWPKMAQNAFILTAVAGTTDLTLTFDRPVIARPKDGLLLITTDVVETEVSFVQNSDTEIVITYSGSIAAATYVDIGRAISEGTIRSRDGGFVSSRRFQPVT